MSKCIICFKEHDQVYGDGVGEPKPSMYCAPCMIIKQDSVNVVTQITDYIFLSGMQPAGNFGGHRLCVHEMTPTYEGQHYHIPILTTRPNSKTDRTGAVASVKELGKAANLIGLYVAKKEKLLVHCYGGVERSPLTIAWYLVQSKQFKTFGEAYAFLKSKRPVVSERLFWLPKGKKKYV